MSRGWNWTDLFGIGNLTGNPDPIWGNLSGENAIKDATAAQQAALSKAFDAIQTYTGKALEQQAPYTQFAGPDFQRQRGLVQSGYYQTPYGKRFTPQAMPSQGFSFNPGQGSASFGQFTPQMNSYTPQGLPPMPSLPAYQPPGGPSAGGGQNPQQPGNPAQMGPGGAQQAFNMLMRNNPMPMVMPTNPNMPAGMGYNAQTGTGNPLQQAGYAPQNANLSYQNMIANILARSPWARGTSGPLEGGMPGRGLL